MLGETGSSILTHFHGKTIAQKVVAQESVSLLQLWDKILP